MHIFIPCTEKTTAKFQNNWWITVKGVAPSRYHFDSISVADPEWVPGWGGGGQMFQLSAIGACKVLVVPESLSLACSI